MANGMHAPQQMLSALSDPTRQVIVGCLRSGAMAVGDLADHVPVSRPAVSQHLKVLTDCGLLAVTPLGTRRLYRIAPDAVAALRDYLDTLWSDALDAYANEARRQAAGVKSQKE